MLRRAVVVGAVAAALAACSFPDVTILPDLPGDGGGDGGGAARPDAMSGHDGSGGSGGDGPGMADVASGDDGWSGESGTDDATTGDAPGGDDGPAASDAPGDVYVFDASPDAPVCDQDQDHFNAKDQTCGGNDCDDHDPRAYPTEPDFLTDPPHAPTNGDWNCDGMIELQWARGMSCGLLSLGNCAATQGFKDTPGCGEVGSFVQCQVSGLLCVEGTPAPMTEGCK
jgi:hypothetical protein